MAQWRLAALLLLAVGVSACGVRGNPRPPLPDVHPLVLPDGGTVAPPVAAPDAGAVGPVAPSLDAGPRLIPRAPVDS
jgi:hypothetical protein